MKEERAREHERVEREHGEARRKNFKKYRENRATKRLLTRKQNSVTLFSARLRVMLSPGIHIYIYI